MPEESPGNESGSERIGLCAKCQNARVVISDRGSTFYMCALSAMDARFPKYPRLPVVQCGGYATKLG